MRTQVLEMIDKLMSAVPDLRATVESSGKSVWVTFVLPGFDTWWELECRELDEIGLHAHVPNDPNDVPFGPPEEFFRSLADAQKRLTELLQHEPA